MSEKVAHGCRRYVCELLRCRDYDGLYLRRQLAVGIGDGPLCLEVYHVPYSSHYMPDPKFAAGVYGEVVVLDYAYALQSGSRLSDDVELLLIRKESSLVYIDTDCHHHLIEHGQSPLEDVQMARCKRVEGPGE